MKKYESTCPNCMHMQAITVRNIHRDKLGPHAICEKCKYSYDVVDISKGNQL